MWDVDHSTEIPGANRSSVPGLKASLNQFQRNLPQESALPWSQVADAEVFHSHSFSEIVEFRRAFDIGAFHSSAPWLHESFGGAGGEGRKFVASELRYLASHAPLHIGSALIRTGMKAVGYSLGRRNNLIPRPLKRHLSLHRDFWECKVAR